MYENQCEKGYKSQVKASTFRATFDNMMCERFCLNAYLPQNAPSVIGVWTLNPPPPGAHDYSSLIQASSQAFRLPSTNMRQERPK